MQWFMRQLETKPVFTKMWSSGLLWGIGDSIAQRIEHSNTADKEKKVFEQDFMRTARLAGFATFLFAPLTHNWYNILQAKFPGESMSAVVKRVSLDQTLYATFILSTLYGTTAIMEGKGVQGAQRRIEDNIVDTLKANWLIWPAVQLVNMKFVPLNSRILVVNAVNIPWTTYLAMRAGSSSAKSNPEQLKPASPPSTEKR